MELYNILIYFATVIGIYSILTMSLNFHYGFSGLVNFGHVGFYAIGAYSSALVTLNGGPIWLGFIAALVFAGIVGILVALPTRNLSIHYWAITTIAIAEIIRLAALNEDWLTRGSFGLLKIPQPLSGYVSSDLYPGLFVVLVWVFVVATFHVLSLLVDSPFGRVLKAIREEEELAMALGKPVFIYKVKAMMIGAMFAGLAGALYAHFVTYISPIDFPPLVTFVLWAMVILGGKGNLWGSVLGAAIVIMFFNGTRYIKDSLPIDPQTLASLRMVIIGLLIVVVILYRPQGLIPEKKKEF